MGTRTDAYYFFGIPLADDVIEPFDEDDEASPRSGPSFMAFFGNSEDGVELVEHCSNECPQYCVALAGTVVRARRGHARRVESPEVHDGGVSALRRFCEKYKLKTVGKPGWYVASYWG